MRKSLKASSGGGVLTGHVAGRDSIVPDSQIRRSGGLLGFPALTPFAVRRTYVRTPPRGLHWYGLRSTAVR
eukprot:7385356-Prymnesium_polylepis.2